MPKTALTRDIFESADEEEQLYFDMIDRVAKDSSDQVISNGRPAHAVYLLHKFFEIAEQNIKIFTGRLSQAHDGVLAYANPKLADAAVNFLQKASTSLSIVIADRLDVAEGENGSNHPFLNRIWNSEPKGQFEVYEASKNESPILPYHFLVMDGSAIRVEMNTEDVTAIASFNSSDLAAGLTSLYDAYVHDRRGRELKN